MGPVGEVPGPSSEPQVSRDKVILEGKRGVWTAGGWVCGPKEAGEEERCGGRQPQCDPASVIDRTSTRRARSPHTGFYVS